MSQNVSLEGLLFRMISLLFNEFNKVKLIDSSDSPPSAAAAAAVLATCCCITFNQTGYLWTFSFTKSQPISYTASASLFTNHPSAVWSTANDAVISMIGNVTPLSADICSISINILFLFPPVWWSVEKGSDTPYFPCCLAYIFGIFWKC